MSDFCETMALFRPRSRHADVVGELLADLDGTVAALRTLGAAREAETRLAELLTESRLEHAPAALLERVHAIMEAELAGAPTLVVIDGGKAGSGEGQS